MSVEKYIGKSSGGFLEVSGRKRRTNSDGGSETDRSFASFLKAKKKMKQKLK